MGSRDQIRGASGATDVTPDDALVEPKPRRPLASAELFAGVNEVEIEHQGELYRLRRTSKGKLILTK